MRGDPTGTYQIQDPAFNGGNPLDVWCDMDTDGGGYTVWPCEGCQARNRAYESNGCSDMGLQYVVPRTQAHWCALYTRYPGFWSAMIGVVGRHRQRLRLPADLLRPEPFKFLNSITVSP